MISMVCSFVKNLVLSPNGRVMKDEESLKYLKDAQGGDCDDSDGLKSLTRTGKVTYMNDKFAIIDKKYHFDVQNVKYKLKKGDVLKYEVEVRDGKEMVKNVMIDEQGAPEAASATLHELCQVVERQGRTVLLTNGLSCSLDEVSADFVPKKGDWVQVHFTVVQSVPRVLAIRAKRLCVRRLRVTRCEDGVGVLSNYVLFDRDSTMIGYLPLPNDQVLARIIEGEYGELNWRALDLQPVVSPLRHKNLLQNLLELEARQADAYGVSVQCSLRVSMSALGEEQLLPVIVRNEAAAPRRLLAVTHAANVVQLSALSALDEAIPPGGVYVVQLACRARIMGATHELLHFDFGEFGIERFVEVSVLPAKFERPCAREHHLRLFQRQARAAHDSLQRRAQLDGQRPGRGPAFVARRLLDYTVPEHLANQYLQLVEMSNSPRTIDMDAVAPDFWAELSMRNYAERFHNLLYIEELSYLIYMHRHDMPHVIFDVQDDFLVMQVEGLRERRPPLSTGDRVLAYPLDAHTECATRLEGYIHRTVGNMVYIKFAEGVHSTYAGEPYRIEFRTSRTNYRRYHVAIDQVHSRFGEVFLFPSQLQLKPPQVPAELDEAPPQAAGEPQTPAPSAQVAPSRLARRIRSLYESKSQIQPRPSGDSNGDDAGSPQAVRIVWNNKNLNYQQKSAVVHILQGVTRPLPYVVFGPPGTGKTVTLVEAVVQICAHHPHSRVLVTAPSNSAANVLAERLVATGALTTQSLLRLSAHRYIMDGAVPDQLAPYTASVDVARELRGAFTPQLLNGVRVDLPRSAVSRFRVVVGTCVSVGALYVMGLSFKHFTHVLVDEAGQCTEPELMIPVSIVNVNTAQIVLAGDPMQLGPFIFSMYSKQKGLSHSFLKRVMDRFPYQRDVSAFPKWGGYDPRIITKLLYNYRSLPQILQLSNSLFYNSDLKPVVSPTEGEAAQILRRAASFLPRPSDNELPPAMVFHGVRGESFRTKDCPSWFNPCEAHQVVYYVKQLYQCGFAKEDIGIISSYVRHGQEIRDLLQQENLEVPKLGSVEDFQGREYKIVVLSTVRSNEEHMDMDTEFNLGFMSHPERLNVACTRAQALHIIVGNPYLLLLDNYWRSVLKYVYSIGGYTGCWLPESLIHSPSQSA